MCKPHSSAELGSLHKLRGCNGEISVFSWQGNAWSTPGTGWGTPCTMMGVLGWKYIGPEIELREAK
jgi:hypothetical protein